MENNNLKPSPSLSFTGQIVLEASESKSVHRQKKFPNFWAGNPGNTGGRPTKYNPAFVDKVDEYMRAVQESKLPHQFYPTLEGFALYIGLSEPQTLKNWANKKVKIIDPKTKQKVITKDLARPEFFVAIRRLETAQKLQLMNDGIYLGKKVNDRMVKFILGVNHGLYETTKTEMDLTSKGEQVKSVVGFNYIQPKQDASDNSNNQTNA